MSSYSKIIAITGATASGKTKLALDLSRQMGGEIVNADSVQVYQELNIGSAKPNVEEQNLVQHHLLSYLKPNESYSAGRFRKDCFEVVRELIDKKRLPIITGGSGLYLSSLFSDFFDDSWFVFDVDNFLSKVSASKSSDDFIQWSRKFLDFLDPVSGKVLPLNDHFRRDRALSLSLSLGAPASALKNSLSMKGESLSGLVIILERERDDLYRRIDTRVNIMIKEGFIEEVSTLISKYGENTASLKAIGYSQVVSYLNQEKQGLISNIEDLIKIIQRDTRRFAKRQLTWWRNQPSKLAWIDVLKFPSIERKISETSHLDFSVGENVVSGNYAEIKTFLEYVIERYRNDSFAGMSKVSAFTSSETSYLNNKNNKSDLVYICRVRCLD